MKTLLTRLTESPGRLALPALRISLALVYLWFGVLKVIGQSPVADLVRATMPWVHGPWLIPALGWAEIALGLLLLLGTPRRLAPIAVAAHLTGTFLVFIQAPTMAIHDNNPLLLTTTGEFVLKNLVLICAALAIFALESPGRTRQPSAGEELVRAPVHTA
ncbi:putative membrane protein YkgB [Actinokineospora baliensis]|uniref:DoxX family membrane protein n=1 Tax=Actinokineospora baliensis TaxID=547056 RepID=UPI0019566B23|nr:DoxX family membrane protein [Actinokineospora baliensis]MBM7775034.1 putative membrane protein YkgB [Actinokineospora baliensis]